MNSKVLYIEDEPFISQIVSEGLESSGFVVKAVADGKLVMEALKVFSPDICVMDIMLPSIDGYSLTAEIRKIDSHIPIIFVSAKSLTEDVVQGFKAGGDDYLKKPFSMDELIVRIESLLARARKFPVIGASVEQRMYEFAGCHFDATHQQLTTPLAKYLLSFKEAALLEMLLQRKNDVLKRQDVLNKIWQEDTYYNTRSMDVFMAHLRKLLKDDPKVQILSLRGVGYKLFC
ncbi:response regulator transcription factor [Pedobacter sp.]|uniref:response regulator transcription factor n=1 Tax=Pedobacter sp. TaxID=1411316 RepID=UPI003D7F2359